MSFTDKINHIKYYSPSELNTASQCGYRHYLKYSLGLRGATSNTLLMGKTFHEVLEQVLIDKKEQTLKELEYYQDLFEKKYISGINISDIVVNGDTVQSEIVQAGELLKQFFADYLPDLTPLAMEVEVKQPISNDYGIYGFVDYLDAKQFFIDYKTTKRTPSKPKASVINQMNMYATALGITQYKIMYFVFKKQPVIKTFEIELNKEQIKLNLFKITNLMETIDAVEYKTPTGLLSDYACDYCNFASVCKYHTQTYIEAQTIELTEDFIRELVERKEKAVVSLEGKNGVFVLPDDATSFIGGILDDIEQDNPPRDVKVHSRFSADDLEELNKWVIK